MAKGRKKPLIGGRKYDRALLKCTVAKCDEEFFVSEACTPAKRKCEKHWQGATLAQKNPTANDLIAILKGRS